MFMYLEPVIECLFRSSLVIARFLVFRMLHCSHRTVVCESINVSIIGFVSIVCYVIFTVNWGGYLIGTDSL